MSQMSPTGQTQQWEFDPAIPTFMCRREGVFIKGEMGQIDHDDDVDEELNLLLAEQLTPSVLTLAKGNDTLERVWDGDEDAVASCTCGPVVVRDETVASSLEYDGSETNAENPNSRKRGKYIQHPLWQQRYLVAANDFNSVFAFYVNELMGIASARPPKPPKQCCGGILADAMGLGKTVMLLALILKTKEQEEVEEVGAVSQENQNIYTNPSQTKRVSNRKMVASNGKSESVYRNDQCDDDDGESWSGERDSTMAKGRPSLKVEKSNGTTLVIAPLSLISQWEEELSTKTDLSHILYYDLNTKRIDGYDFASVDVVITTYGTVQSLFESFSRSGSVDSKHRHSMFNFGWKRIILDEAHVIKNPATLISKACCTLQSETRWCVTGTPIQNSLQDIYGLLKFLRHEPWCGAAFWRNAITDPVAVCNGNSSDEINANDDTKDFSSIAAFGRVRRLLAPILLRRIKSTLTADGTPIITLPPIDYSVVHVTLSTPEREFYNALLERSQSIFEGFLSAGTASKSWLAIFSLLQRLRQACDHVSLTVSKNTSEVARSKNSTDFAQIDTTSAVDNDFLSGLLMKFNKTSNGVVASANGESTFAKQVAETLSKCVRSSDEFLKSECPICLDEPRVEDAVYTPCAHMFCRDCLLSVFREQMIRAKKTNVPNAPAACGAGGGNCPVCHSFVNQSFLVQILRSENGEAVSKFLDPLSESEKENSPNAATETKPRVSSARVTLESAINGAGSSKLYSILSELEKVRNDGKVLIFSQYLGFLDIIGTALHKLGIECFRIDGCMSLKERVSAMGRFNKSRSGSVFLISMKAGGVGLNLVAASTVFIVDPWWNQALEDQCINRIHRIGQRAKIVRVRKFVVTDSVEEKIVNLQGKKKGMANVILSEVDDGYRLDGAAKPSLEDFKLLLGRY
ncbi:hypothetical protein ACHAWU_005124 [Discostella pseudostelligera]|uniref:DNA repair protein RAD5 n=1 Tax=Discostella pseudostelligera TaxID=259834 RepID=A0ABD3M3W5_9STRA